MDLLEILSPEYSVCTAKGIVSGYTYHICSCFHGFARHADAVEALKGKPGHFLVRYSESQLKDGFFAFNINRSKYHISDQPVFSQQWCEGCH